MYPNSAVAPHPAIARLQKLFLVISPLKVTLTFKLLLTLIPKLCMLSHFPKLRSSAKNDEVLPVLHLVYSAVSSTDRECSINMLFIPQKVNLK